MKSLPFLLAILRWEFSVLAEVFYVLMSTLDYLEYVLT